MPRAPAGRWRECDAHPPRTRSRGSYPFPLRTTRPARFAAWSRAGTVCSCERSGRRDCADAAPATRRQLRRRGRRARAALEYVPALDDAALTAPAFAALPVIAAEALSFDTLQLRDKAVLKIKKISVDRGRIHRTDSQVKIFVRQRRDVRCRAGTACRRSGCLPRRRTRAVAPP